MKNAHTQHGFTVLELLVTMAIIGVLSTIIVVRLAGTTDPIELQNATSIVRTDISSTITWAQTGRIEETTGEVPFGYGVIFVKGKDQYDIYAEFDGDAAFTEGGNDVVVSTVNLTQDEYIQNIVFADCAPLATLGGNEVCDVFVEQPTARLYINGTQNADELRLVIEHTNSEDQKQLRITRNSGKIDEL